MKSKKRRVHLAVGGVLLTVGVVLIAVVAFTGFKPGETPGISSHGRPITNVRTVIVTDDQSTEVSMPGRPLRAVLVTGTMPSGPMMGTVLSDENCEPDAQGVSHCTNRLRMDGGMEMTVMHPHRMADVPCLATGERVSVQTA